MPLTVVVGGQFGGEGKGAITSFVAMRDTVQILVKTGGPNSAHSYGRRGKLMRVRMVPCGADLGPSTLIFPAGCLIHPETLLAEINELGFTGQIIIDPQAGIVESAHIHEQGNDPFYDTVGSTLTGTGVATASRARRRLRLAKDEPLLTTWIGETMLFLDQALERGESVLIEGSQAFGLSNYHGDYPFTTSRDTTVGTFLGQVGVGPARLNQIVLVIKCFPTRNRVGNGRLPGELPDDFVLKNADSLQEHGGGTYGEVGNLRRRVGFFDFDLVHRAIVANTPDFLALTGLDRLAALQGEESVQRHYGSPQDFIHHLEQMYGIPVSLLSWGPYLDDVIDNRLIQHLS